MPEISFYIMQNHSAEQRLLALCKLLEKIYRSKARVYVHTETDSQSNQLDSLLWRFREGSFIPHAIYKGNAPDQLNSVLLGTLAAPENWQDIQINLTQRQIKDISSCQRLLEFLDSTEASKQAGRARYRDYQQQGFKINTHNI